MVDIEQMFHSFLVQEKHRDLLRFFWFKDNDPTKPLTEYRMRVHVFGNTSSPAVATYGLRKTAEVGESEFGSDAKDLVDKNFYVDDALKSVATPSEAINLLRRTQAMLATANLRLHKFAWSHSEVTQAFPEEDQATDIRNLDLSKDNIPVRRSLGVFWDLKTDAFTLKVSSENKPFLRRGVLSTINSPYDPLGLAAPVTIIGKFLLRSMSANLSDAPLPEEQRPVWEHWRQSLLALDQVRVPHAYSSSLLNAAHRVELHTFCDASNEAIGAVSYLKSVHDDRHVQVSFVLEKANLAPTHATTIPRLELCAAVLGVEVAELVIEELDLEPQVTMCYSDSRVVLGYISNEIRRFYVYVSNRVQRIRSSTSPNQWHYVPTDLNPADLATRSVDADKLSNSIWHTGPAFLYKHTATNTPVSSFASESRKDDPEVKTLK